MTTTNEGFIGAKVQSWRRSNPRDLLKEIVDANPGAAKSTIYEKLSQKILADEDIMASVLEYWFTNNYNSLVDPRPRASKSSSARPAQVAGLSEQIKQKVKQQAAILLLDMVMPNGKPLKECTGRDCKHLSVAIGPWLEMVADRLKPSQLVGEHLKETDLKEMYSLCANR